MKRALIALSVLALAALGAPAKAVIDTIDTVPAATLLVPYFEVDLTHPNGTNTLFSVNNASATAILAHVVVWSDQSIPVLDFDIYLTGYDVQTISMRDILQNGNLPITASAGQDPGDHISPKGPVSQDINFASCSGVLPYTNPEVSAAFRAHLQAILQGNPSPVTGSCYGSKKKDGVLRGYVTVDTVNACNLFDPSTFATYAPFLTDQNVLWGDWFMVNPDNNSASGDDTVNIEAFPTGFAPGDHTFYGRYNAATAADHREPLPTTWAARYVNGGGFDGGTDFLIWREGNNAAAAYPCALSGPSAWYPLPATQIVVFDEEEQPVTQNQCPSGDPTCTTTVLIPNETQRVDVATDLLSPFDFGWVYLNLQHTKLIAAYGDTDAQSWVAVNMSAEGRYEVGYPGTALDNANTPNTTIIPVN